MIADTSATPASISYDYVSDSSLTGSEKRIKDHESEVEKTFEIHSSSGSDISSLELPPSAFPNSTGTGTNAKLFESYCEEEEVQDEIEDEEDEEEEERVYRSKVIVSAQWAVSLANAADETEEDLDTVLVGAIEAGCSKASMEEELTTARVEAELKVKQLRERLEEKIKDALMIELELENAQDSIKEKEKEFKSEKNHLQAKMEMEMKSIRNERTALLVKVAALEEENAILCAKLLDGTSGMNQKKNGLAATACHRLISHLANLKHYGERHWKSRKRSAQL